jgi:hypothetical protein
MTLLPVVFVAGPSGVGKSDISARVAAALQFRLLEIDSGGGMTGHGLHTQWNRFSHHLDPASLALALRNLVAEADRAGAVLDFPSTVVFSREMIDAARAVGIRTVVLWGPEELCKKARRERDGELDERRYDRSNRRAFDTYGGSDYDDVRVEAFSPDGLRKSFDDLVEIIRERVASLLREFGAT